MAQYVRRVANSSAKNKLIIPAELEVPYGSGRNPGEKLDILGAEALPGEAPIFVFIHGGYWQVRRAIGRIFLINRRIFYLILHRKALGRWLRQWLEL